MHIEQVTIGVTCFNAEATIFDAVSSAIMQDYPNKQIIVFDDASTDGSVQILEEIAKSHPIKIIRSSDNLGYANALNRIIEESSGDFIAFFDDDDISSTDRISKQVARIRAHESTNALLLCYTDRQVIGLEIERRVQAIGSVNAPYGKYVSDYILRGIEAPDYSWGEFGSCTLCARRGVFESIGPFDTGFRRSAELDFAIRAGSAGAAFGSVPSPLVTQRITAGVGDEKSNSKSLVYSLKLRAKHAGLFPDRASYLASGAWLRARSSWARGDNLLWRLYLLAAMVLCPRLRRTAMGKSRFAQLVGLGRRQQMKSLWP